jgi:hypothetical protein
MGREGFEPPKRFRSGFTARPVWPLWNLPDISNFSLINFLGYPDIRSSLPAAMKAFPKN